MFPLNPAYRCAHAGYLLKGIRTALTEIAQILADKEKVGGMNQSFTAPHPDAPTYKA
jgi:hypothetical protein